MPERIKRHSANACIYLFCKHIKNNKIYKISYNKIKHFLLNTNNIILKDIILY